MSSDCNDLAQADGNRSSLISQFLRPFNYLFFQQGDSKDSNDFPGENKTEEDSLDIRKKYDELRVFKEPMCLINNNDDGTLVIARDVLEEISTIDDTVNVIAIAGPYRTGKSYLMNRLAGENRGFPIGSTTNAETKGIWVRCLQHPKRPAEVLMVIDTEGIGDINKDNDETDISILCLATLLSGTFVYNVMGVADKNLLESLSFVTKISKKIVLSRKPSRALPDVGFLFPSFVLCLRDFTLSLGEDVSPNQYFENCLIIKSKKDEKTEQYNELKLRFKQFFEKRSCFTFDRPTTDRKHLAKLDQLNDSELSKEFREDTNAFLQHIFECKPKSSLDGMLIKGRMLADLVKEYTHAIQSGEIACIYETLTNMSMREYYNALKISVQMIKEMTKSMPLPLPDDFESKYKDIQREALKRFREIAVLDDEQKMQKLAEEEMNKVKDKVVEKNKLFIKETSTKELQNTYDKIIQAKVDNGTYFVPGGYMAYRDDFAELKECMTKKFPKGYSNLIQICANEFEGKFREQDQEILKTVDTIESKKRAEVEEEKKTLEKKIEELKRDTENKMKKIEQISAERENIKAEYEKEAILWKTKEEKFQKEIKGLKLQLRTRENLIEKMKTTTSGTFFKTAFNLIPVVGPLTTGAYELYNSSSLD